MKVFIENEAGSRLKHLYNEKTLKPRGTQSVSRPYPFPYGFVLDTTADDGDNVDCFVLTRTPLSRGMIIDCDPIALMEQIEDGQTDHKILAVLKNDRFTSSTVQQELRDFAAHVFEHIPGKQIRVGAFKSRDSALQYISDCQEPQRG